MCSSPIYTRNALRGGIEGSVTVQFEIAVDGSVKNVRAIQAVLAGIFDQASEQACADGDKFPIQKSCFTELIFARCLFLS